MKKIFTLILSVSLLFTLSACGKEKLIKYEGTWNKLNTVVSVMLYHTKDVDVDKMEQEIVDILDYYDNTYDPYDETTTLGILNATAYDNPVKVDDQMFDMIDKAIEYAKIYPGTYDPTIHPLALLWDIDEDSYFRGGVVPSQEEIDKTLEVTGYDLVELDEVNKTVKFLKDGVAINLGSVVKGYIVDDIMLILEKYHVEHAIINAGSSSQIYIGTRVKADTSGKEPVYEVTDDAWTTGISAPWDLFGFQIMGYYAVTDTSTSGSGIYRQYFKDEQGNLYHHILNPTTGYPVDNELEFVQIFTDDYLGADIISTMLFCLGLDEAMNYMNSRDDLSGFVITKDKKIYVSKDCPEILLYDNYKDYEIIEYEK